MKEAQEKIEDILKRFGNSMDAYDADGDSLDINQALSAIKKVLKGYHKLPEGEVSKLSESLGGKVQLLASALRQVLIKCCVLNTDTEPNGAELIAASEEYCKSDIPKPPEGEMPLLGDEEIKALCVKYLGWDKPVSDRDLKLVKPLFQAQRELCKRGE